MIDINILLACGATYKKVEKDEVIFEEGSHCLYYYQLIEGRVKWVNINEAGKEFIQNIIEPGESFGELPLFDDGVYAASSIADKNSLVIRLPKLAFINLLHEFPEMHFKFTRLLAFRLRYKFLILKTIASENPQARIVALLNYLKEENHNNGCKMEIKLTRQQIANMTGLRVETVIREIKKLNRNHFVSIEKGKVFY
jgi:CRP/FNR family transcriptional regulator, cyclic AMP receptor protein